jgi:hypothetical protein
MKNLLSFAMFLVEPTQKIVTVEKYPENCQEFEHVSVFSDIRFCARKVLLTLVNYLDKQTEKRRTGKFKL